MGYIEFGAIGFLVFFLAMAVITFIYCMTIYKTLQLIPKENHQFPSWLVWLFLIPWVSFIFQWIMLPFGIPNTLKNAFSKNQDAIQAANNLFKLGLAQVTFTTLSIFPMRPLNMLLAFAGIACWIFYWVLLVQFKNQYLGRC